MARQPPLAHASAPARVAGLDALRGLAVLAMVAYHFAFDLAFFRAIEANFYRDAFWLHARTAILTTFLLLAGASLVLAERSPAGRAAFWPHVGRIALCALAVSAGSWLVFPRSFIWFGVLHAIAVSLILARPLAARPAVALAVGVAAIVAGNVLAFPAFDTRALGWIGFATAKPVTEDYVPLFPWSGVVLLGIVFAHALRRNEFRAVAWLGHAPPWVMWLGRHSLLVYMVHQPALLALVWLGVKTARTL